MIEATLARREGRSYDRDALPPEQRYNIVLPGDVHGGNLARTRRNQRLADRNPYANASVKPYEEYLILIPFLSIPLPELPFGLPMNFANDAKTYGRTCSKP